MTHELRCWPATFQAVWSGEAHHQVRRKDRAFAVGDLLRLREWDPARQPHPDFDRYTGRLINVRVTFISEPDTFWLPADVCVLSIEPCTRVLPGTKRVDAEAGL